MEQAMSLSAEEFIDLAEEDEDVAVAGKKTLIKFNLNKKV